MMDEEDIDDFKSTTSSTNDDADELDVTQVVLLDGKNKLVDTEDNEEQQDEEDAEKHKEGTDLEHEQHEQRHEKETTWMKREKNVLVFSRAGKPVYSSNEDELELSSVFSLMQAMLARTEDRLRVIRAGKDFVMVFTVRGPLMLVIISRLEEPVGYLQLQLEYIYAQILFHFTLTALDDTFRRKPGYDLRALLGGTRTELEGIMEMANMSPSILLEAVPSLWVPLDIRTSATNILYSAKNPNLLYAILFADSKLVAHVTPKRHPLKCSDMLLLSNFVRKAKQLQSQETWTPLCLPAFNSTGFLHAYAAYVSKSICLLLLSSGESLEQFHFCSDSKQSIANQLKTTGTGAKIENAIVNQNSVTPGSCDAASAIHLVYRSLKYDQYFETTVSSHAPLHMGARPRERLMSRYINISERLHSYPRDINIVAPLPKPDGTSPNSNKLSYAELAQQGAIWDVRESEAILGVINPSQYEIYASFHIFTTSTQAMACVTRFAAWVRNARHDLFRGKTSNW